MGTTYFGRHSAGSHRLRRTTTRPVVVASFPLCRHEFFPREIEPYKHNIREISVFL